MWKNFANTDDPSYVKWRLEEETKIKEWNSGKIVGAVSTRDIEIKIYEEKDLAEQSLEDIIHMPLELLMDLVIPAVMGRLSIRRV